MYLLTNSLVRNYGEPVDHMPREPKPENGLTAWTVRPEFTGTLAIKGGRHPVLESVQSAGAMVPNDVYCCEASSFQIVQGPKCVPSPIPCTTDSSSSE